jgi:hypothetical protein
MHGRGERLPEIRSERGTASPDRSSKLLEGPRFREPRLESAARGDRVGGRRLDAAAACRDMDWRHMAVQGRFGEEAFEEPPLNRSSRRWQS